jgi:hypothetical protein
MRWSILSKELHILEVHIPEALAVLEEPFHRLNISLISKIFTED